jgi:hypothetical protein
MKAVKPLVSVIVTNYNGKRYLKKCFDSLLKQTYRNIELIFADDGSNDGSVMYMKKYYPQIIRSVNQENSGLSVTSNNAAFLAKGKYLLFYNNDTVAYPDFIEQMVEVAKGDKKVGVVCPIQMPYRRSNDKKMTEDQKDIGVGSDIYGYICTARDAGHIFYPDAAIFIRHGLFKQIKGFDPDFFLYGEDMDICWRVHLTGRKIAVAHKAIFRHDSYCAKKANGRFVTNYKRRYFVERQVINKILKYYQASTLIWILPKFLFFYFAEALFFLLIKLNFNMFFSVYIKAILWNLTKINNVLKNRRHIQRIRKVNDKYILNLMYPKYRKLEVALKSGVPIIK